MGQFYWLDKQSICNTITYDYFRNKPITITGTGGIITYTYNSKGELIERTYTSGENTVWRHVK